MAIGGIAAAESSDLEPFGGSGNVLGRATEIKARTPHAS